MMDSLRLRLLTALRDGPCDMDDLADRLTVRTGLVYRELELMLSDGLVGQLNPNSDVYGLTELGRKALDVLASAKAGPPGWKQSELW